MHILEAALVANLKHRPPNENGLGRLKPTLDTRAVGRLAAALIAIAIFFNIMEIVSLQAPSGATAGTAELNGG